MNDKDRQTPWTCYAYIALLAAGILLLGVTLQSALDYAAKKDLGTAALGLLLIGGGEWLNHPRQQEVIIHDGKELSFSHVTHRRRNPCALGSVLEAAGILLLLSGILGFLGLFRA